MDLLSRIRDRSARVAVIGLGYVGHPLSAAAAAAGFRVTGMDTDSQRVAELNEVSSELLQFSDDPQVLGEAEIILICVPTPLKDELPDMSYVRAAAEDIARSLKPRTLVILESTTYPGTTEELLLGILESSGLKAGVDFHLGFSPERIDPGNQSFDLINTPKIVGGIDQTSTDLMEAFYSGFIDKIVRVSSPKAAEMAKLLENTYRHVNIALINEIAILCHDLGIDVWEVVDAAATKPFGFQAFYPGPGWGGHCIPVDPSYLSWRVRQLGSTARFIELAREFNTKMPEYIVQRIGEALNDQGKSLKGARVLVLGVTYKADIGDLRESPAIEIIERLAKSGVEVSFNDPFVERLDTNGGALEGTSLENVTDADLVLIHTAHASYDFKDLTGRARLIFDTRNACQGLGGAVIKL